MEKLYITSVAILSKRNSAGLNGYLRSFKLQPWKYRVSILLRNVGELVMEYKALPEIGTPNAEHHVTNGLIVLYLSHYKLQQWHHNSLEPTTTADGRVGRFSYFVRYLCSKRPLRTSVWRGGNKEAQRLPVFLLNIHKESPWLSHDIEVPFPNVHREDFSGGGGIRRNSDLHT
jgi:hypothetical protein